MSTVTFRIGVLVPVFLGLGLLSLSKMAVASVSIADSLLSQKMKFSAADLRAFDAGTAVIKTLETPVREELAFAAAVYFDAPPETFVEKFRDIERFESGPGIPQIGRFRSPPALEDLAALRLTPADVATLRTCRPGDCGMKLSAPAMRRFRDEVDWSSSNAAGQAEEIVREMILGLMHAYQAEGNAALGHYEDGDEPLPVAEQFRAILASSDSLPVPVPELLTYLDDFPRGRLEGAEDFFYWTVVDFGLKPTIRVNHVTIYPPGGSSPPSGVKYVIAIKQLYASHYFHTTLELRFLLADDRRSSQGTSLISITRARNDGMTGFKGLFLRPIIRNRSRDAVRSYLEHVKRQVERPAPVP